MQNSLEMTPKPSSPENCTGNLTLTGVKESAAGRKKLLDLTSTAIQALPLRSRAPLSSPPLARMAEERGPAD
jgi:hypothetical protein